MTFRDFSKPLPCGQCAVCRHYGKDCHCHKNPGKAVQKYLDLLRQQAAKAVSTLEAAEAHYHVPLTTPKQPLTDMDLFRAAQRLHHPNDYIRQDIVNYGLLLLAAVRATRSATFSVSELGSAYVNRDDRYVVSLLASYNRGAEVRGAKGAARAALQMVLDRKAGAGDTEWCCFDRSTEKMHRFYQRDLEQPR